MVRERRSGSQLIERTSFQHRSHRTAAPSLLFGSSRDATERDRYLHAFRSQATDAKTETLIAARGVQISVRRIHRMGNGSRTTRMSPANSRSSSVRFQTWRTADWQISTAGGTRAAWARNGRELFYLDKDGLLTSVSVLAAGGAVFRRCAGQDSRHAVITGRIALGLDLRSLRCFAGRPALPDDQGDRTVAPTTENLAQHGRRAELGRGS